MNIVSKTVSIGIVICNYGLGTSSQLLYLSRELVKAGFEVDILHYGMRYEEYVTFGKGIQQFKIETTKWSLSENIRITLARCVEILRQKVWCKINGAAWPREKSAAAKIVAKAKVALQRKKYEAVIGIDTYGIILGGIACRYLGIPIYYYNLELRSLRSTRYSGNPDFHKLKKLEAYYHLRCSGTIIQDPQRAAFLFSDNGVPFENVWYLPVSICGPAMATPTRYLQDRHSLESERVVILQLGFIGERSLSHEIIERVVGFPEKWSVVLHGFFQKGFDQSVKDLVLAKKLDSKRLIVSTDKLNLDNLWELVASSHIGLVFYTHADENETLLGHASEKLARYLHCSIPVITTDAPQFLEIIGKYRCGITIKSIDELHQAIETILEDYEGYRQPAIECFNEEYEFRKWFHPFAKHLQTEVPAVK